ncbi:MAG: carboxypeptidase-like regulatory domain-containing protein, partial [Candidatus Saccharibacteria bacterium]
MNRFFRARSVNIKLIKPSKYKYLTLILLIVLGLIISVGHTRAQNLNTLSGVIVDSSNSAVKFATISLLDQNGSVQGTITSGIDGSYSMTVPPGSYSLRFRSPDASDYIDHHLDYLYSSQSGTPIDLSSGDAVINLRLQTATLHVLVNDARGNPVTNASVSVFSKANTGGTMSLYPGDPGETIYGSSSGNNNDSFTNSSGMVDITTVVGENLGTNRNEGSLCAQVSGSYVCLPNPLTIIGDANITLTAPESRNFSGQMVDSIGAAVKYVSIILKSSDGSQSTGYSDGNGMFSIDVKPNVYSLSLLTDGSDPIGQHLDWLNTVQIGTPSIDLTTADISQTLKLDTVNIHVIVKDSDNNLLSNVQVGGAANYADGGTMSLYPGDPGESIRAAYYGVIQPLYTDASGSINLTGIVGEKFGTTHDLGSICANIAGNYTCLVAPTTISGDATITLIKPAIHTLSGTLKDADNNPLKNITLDLLNASGVLKGSVTTDVSGQYSLSMVPGKYRLHVAIANAIDYVGHHLDDLSISQSDTSIDLTLGNVQQGLQLKTSTIHVTVKDVAGNVVANAPVSAKAPTTDGGATQLYAGDPGENIYKANTGTNSDSFTDTNGNVDITTIVGEKFGQTYDAGSICAIVAGNYVCLNSPLTIIGDSNLILQSSSAAPQNLTATSPTQLPTLNWTTVSGAT